MRTSRNEKARISAGLMYFLAPRAGLEPATCGLTVDLADCFIDNVPANARPQPLILFMTVTSLNA